MSWRVSRRGFFGLLGAAAGLLGFGRAGREPSPLPYVKFNDDGPGSLLTVDEVRRMYDLSPHVRPLTPVEISLWVWWRAWRGRTK